MRLCVLSFLTSFVLSAAPVPKDVTFHKDIEPLLQARCQGCHHSGGAAPMALVTYKDAATRARLIKEMVASRRMPPWFADPAHGQFKNDARLSADEIAMLTAWVDGGAKEGPVAPAPRARTFTEGWTIGKPDAIVEMPTAFNVPADGTVDYQYIVVPTGFTEDKWVQATETQPGDKSVVHHIVMLVRPPGVKYLPDAQPGVPYSTRVDSSAKRKEDTGQGAFQFAGAVEIGGLYVPGGPPYTVEPGQARFVPKGSDLIFQMHYTAKGKPASDRSRIGFIFAKEPPKERVVNTFIANMNMHIAPEDPNAAVMARVTMNAETRLMAMEPHAHVRGKSFEYRAIYPSGESEILLSVPNYDFNWQLAYRLKEPKVLPKGTVIECVAHYDNSAGNPSNPNPKADVYWGEQTWEEMLAGFVDLAMPVTQTMRDVAVGPRPVAAVVKGTN